MAQFARPDNDDSNPGGWVPEIGGTLYGELNESVPSDADFADTGAGNTGYFEVGLSPVDDPGVGTGHVLRYHLRRSNASKAQTQVVSLYDGAVEIASWTHENPTDAFVLFQRTLSEAQANNISGAGYAGALKVRDDATVTANPGHGEISWVELEVPAATTPVQVVRGVSSEFFLEVAPEVRGLPAEFLLEATKARDLPAEFFLEVAPEVRGLPAEFLLEAAKARALPAECLLEEAKARGLSAEFLLEAAKARGLSAEFLLEAAKARTLLAEFLLEEGSGGNGGVAGITRLGLYGGPRSGRGADFSVAKGLSAEFLLEASRVRDLPAEFLLEGVLQKVRDLPTEFLLEGAKARDIPTEFLLEVNTTVGRSYLDLPGTLDNYVSAPDISAYDAATSLDILMHLRLEDYAAVAVQMFFGIGPTFQDYFGINNVGKLIYLNNSLTNIADSAVSASDGEKTWLWVHVTVGAGDGTVTFYESASDTNDPDLVSWSEISNHGSLTILALAHTSGVEIGAYSGGAAGLGDCDYYRAILKIDGVVQFDEDFTTENPGAASLTEDSPNAATLTIHQSGTPQAKIAGPGILPTEFLLEVARARSLQAEFLLEIAPKIAAIQAEFLLEAEAKIAAIQAELLLEIEKVRGIPTEFLLEGVLEKVRGIPTEFLLEASRGRELQAELLLEIEKVRGIPTEFLLEASRGRELQAEFLLEAEKVRDLQAEFILEVEKIRGLQAEFLLEIAPKIAAIQAEFLLEASRARGIPAEFLLDGFIQKVRGIQAEFLLEASRARGIPAEFLLEGAKERGIQAEFLLEGAKERGIPTEFLLAAVPKIRPLPAEVLSKQGTKVRGIPMDWFAYRSFAVGLPADFWLAGFSTGGGTGRREYLADFDEGDVFGTSFLRRPDAVSRSMLNAFAPGPRALNDSTEGLLVKGWTVRADNSEGKVYITEAKDEIRLGWHDEAEWFSYTGDDIKELDFAFDQNGAPVLVAQRVNNLWIYYFKPSAGEYVFEDFGPGLYPKILLDNPFHVDDSDLLVWYSAGGFLVYRKQRDLYVSSNPTSIGLSGAQYVEGTVVDDLLRIHVIISTRFAGAGTWSLERITSDLYPYYHPPEAMAVGNRTIDALIETVILVYEPPIEGMDIRSIAASALLQYVVWGEDILDEADLACEVVSIATPIKVIHYDDGLIYPMDVENESISGTLEFKTIHYDDGLIYSMDVENESISGTLVVP